MRTIFAPLNPTALLQGADCVFFSHAKRDWVPVRYVCTYKGGVVIERDNRFHHVSLNHVMMVVHVQEASNEEQSDYKVGDKGDID